MYKKVVALYDINWHGHHPMYLGILTKILLEEGYTVWVLCQKPDEIKEWISAQSQLPIDHLKLKKIHSFLQSVPPLVRGFIHWIYAHKKISALQKKEGRRPDFVFFLKLEDYIKTLIPKKIVDHLFPYPWIGLIVHLNIFNEKQRQLISTSAVLQSKNCKGIFILQEDCIDQLRALIPQNVYQLPDFTYESSAEESPLVRDIQQKANGRKIISLLGGQEKRKGTFLLYEIAQRTKENPWFYVFAGKMLLPKAERELELFKNHIAKKSNTNCYFHLDYLKNDEEFNAIIKISDVIFTVYQSFPPYSSNIPTKAAFFHKPIVTHSNSLLAQRVDKSRIGLHCQPNDINAVIKAIEYFTTHRIPEINFNAYFEEHSQRKLKEVLTKVLHQK
jgi:glycosyltransferase involved in cell wall biosynthesis